jgi:hypothetical protein
MRSNCLSGLAITLLASLLPTLAFAIEPEPLPRGKDEVRWEGAQFVSADKSGNIFFFRADTFEVYPLARSGVLGKPTQLETSAGSGGLVKQVALGPNGDRWLVRGSRGVRLFVDGKEKPVPPLDWQPLAATFRRDTLVVSLVPFSNRGIPDSSKVKELPWLQSLDDDGWTTLATREGPSLHEMVKHLSWIVEAYEQDTLTLTADRRGRLWAARRYAYRIQQLKPGGQVLTEFLIDGGKVRKQQDSKAVAVQRTDPTANARDATQNPTTEKATFFPFVAEPVIYGVVAGLDGRLYFLVVPKAGGLALDRYDPVRSVLERVPLKWSLADDVTLAAGKDGLYLAPEKYDKGRWRIPWENLNNAAWKKVEGVTQKNDASQPAED